MGIGFKTMMTTRAAANRSTGFGTVSAVGKRDRLKGKEIESNEGWIDMEEDDEDD